MIYVGDKAATLYKGDGKPATLYKGATKIAGWTVATDSGTIEGTYNDHVRGLTLLGNSAQTGTPDYNTPRDIVPVTNPTITVGTQTVQLPYTLHGASATYRDTVEMADGAVRLVEKNKLMTLRGTSDWGIGNYGEMWAYGYCGFVVSGLLVSTISQGVGICTHGLFTDNGGVIYPQRNYRDAVTVYSNTVRIHILRTHIGATANSTQTECLELFQMWLEAQNTAGTPVQILYPIANSTTVITETAVGQALLGLRTTMGSTTVSADAGTLSVTVRKADNQ